MKKAFRKTLWGLIIGLAAILTVSLTVGLTAGPGWAATTGVRVLVVNDTSDKDFVAEFWGLEDAGHSVEAVDANGFVHFSAEATAWFIRETNYRYNIKISPAEDSATPCCYVSLRLENVWLTGPKVLACQADVGLAGSPKTCCSAETYTNNHCNLRVNIR